MIKSLNLNFSKLLIVFCSMLFSCQSNALEIALSFDDAPQASGPILTGSERANRLIQSLKSKNVQEVAFFCSNILNFSEEDQIRIRNYAEAGHIIANHTASHLNFYNPLVTVNKLIADIQEADKKLSVFPNYKRWFRYPYLRQSKFKLNSSNNRDVEIFLEKEKYKHGYVTIETYDWYLNLLIKQDIEKGINPDIDKMKEAYISMLWDGIEFYDTLAKMVLNGRSPKHIILLHENDINALFIGDLIEHIRSKGGKIIPISEAYTDPIASKELDLIPYSQRRIRAIAKHSNYQGTVISQYEDEENIDKLYKKIMKKCRVPCR